jgi:hypothetical protein
MSIDEMDFEEWLHKQELKYGPWKTVFLWQPKMYKWRVYWLRNMHKRANYVEGGYEYKTHRQFIIDELKGKN